MTGQGAPRDNTNAASHGLYSSSPARRIKIPAGATGNELAGYARDLASGALWIAEALTVIGAESTHIRGLEQVIPLYAAVAQELEQTGAEIFGEIGVKPSALGSLNDDQYETLMRKQARALELIINQCQGAWERLKIEEEIRQAVANADGRKVIGSLSGLLGMDDQGYMAINPVLKYLAGHMRTANRAVRKMAANRAWKLRGSERDDDLSARILSMME